MRNFFKYMFFSVCIFVAITSCNRVKTIPEIKETYADGKPKKVDEYILDENGKKILYKETYYFPGEKRFIEGTYNNALARNGVWISWYESGQKNSEQEYIDGKENGAYRVWYPNGKIYLEGNYEKGRKTGVWSFYDTLGKMTKEADFGK